MLVIHGDDQGTRFSISETSVKIGRGVHNAIRLLDTEVSRQHAIITREEGDYLIEDQHSSNGTFLNGKPIEKSRLRHGDRLHLGKSVLLFTLPKQANESSVFDKIRFHEQDPSEDESQIVEQMGHELIDPGLQQAVEDSSNHQLSRMVNQLQLLYKVSEIASTPFPTDEQLLKRILILSMNAVQADRGCILLMDKETEELKPFVFSDQRPTDESGRMPVSRTIVNYVIHHSQGVRTTDARKDQRFSSEESIVSAGIREAICVPMLVGEEMMGVIYVDTTSSSDQFHSNTHQTHFREEHLRLLLAIGRQAAMAVENNRYQNALVQAERLAAVGQTIAMLSHHIKNILQGVRGGSYLIEKGLDDQEHSMIQKGWDIVEKNQNKIYHLVMDMLSYSKDRAPVLEWNDLNQTVDEICEMLAVRASEHGVLLRYEPATQSLETLFDLEGIHRSVMNVIINAIEATEGREDAIVLVKTGYRIDGDVYFVSIADNGPGIPQHQLGKIFNLFESNKGSRGTGLGLAVSRKILREHGGDIRVDNKPGEGCRFWISWPRIEQEPDSEHLESNTNAPE